MKQNKVKIYAQVLADLALAKKSAEDEARMAKNFVKLLEKNRDLGKAKEILAMAEVLFAKKNGNKKIVVETAREIKPSQKEIIKSITKQGDIVLEKINKDLIAGIKIIMDDRQLDLSMQKKLQNIFK